jgi:hypothetical protein
VNPQKNTLSATGSGNASTPARALRRLVVPIEAVGQATSAMRASRSSASEAGCRYTLDCPP